MEIEIYHPVDFQDVPEGLFWALDGVDDTYMAAFANYPDSDKIVVAAWGITGEAAGEPIAALVATEGHIITGYIDPPYTYMLDHQEPGPHRRRARLLTRLRRATQATWLLVHDADEIEGWTRQGFRIVEPPADVPADEALIVLAWGELPEDVYALMKARGLSWNLKAHRGFRREGQEGQDGG